MHIATIRPAALDGRLPRPVPGLAVAAAVATAATVVGRIVPVVGAPVIAILIGAVVGALLGRTARGTAPLEPGMELARQRLLGAAIVIMGLGLPLGSVLTVGRQTVLVMLGTFAVGTICAVVVGRMLALDRESATLVAVGTTICGASAIAAATAVLRPGKDRVAYALGTIFVFNVVAVLVYPPLGHLLGLSQRAFGLWSGTAINDTSSVLAAGVVFGAAAAHFAIIVKMVRSLMIIPVCVGLHWGRSRSGLENGSLLKAFPLFVVLFAVVSVVAASGVVPHAWSAPLAQLSGWMIATVLAAIGMSLTWRQVRAAGTRPLLFGGVLAVCLAVASLGIMAATGWW